MRLTGPCTGVLVLTFALAVHGCDENASDRPPAGSTRPSSLPSTASAEQAPAFVDLVVSVPETPVEVVAADGSVWVVSHRSGEITRIDPENGQVQATIPSLGTKLIGGVAAVGHVWFLDASSGEVKAIDTRTNQIDVTVPVNSDGGGLTAAADGVWFAGTSGRAVHIDRSGRVLTSVRIAGRGDFIIPWMLNGTVYVAETDTGHLSALDATSGRVLRRDHVGGDIGVLYSTPGTLWAGALSGPLHEVDPATGRVTETYDLPAVDHLVLCHELMWVRVSDTSILGLDPSTGAVERRIVGLPAAEVPGGGITCVGDALWVANWSDSTVWELPLG